MSRRDLLRGAGLLGAVTVVGGCSSDREPVPRVEPPPPSASATTGSETPAAPLPSTRPWRPAAAEIMPKVKRQATGLVEAAGAWTNSRGELAAARARLSAAGFDAALAEQLGDLLGGGEAAVVQVRVAQYGGILPSSASVLMVVDQWRQTPDGRVGAVGTTLDVRLERDDPHWRVTQVRAARPDPRQVGLPRRSRRLLENERVALPPAAASDVRDGTVQAVVVEALNELSRDFEVGVSILRSGHPIRVFGTDRRSSHTDGLAVDVWSVDERPVIEAGSSRLVGDFMQAAAATGAFQVGGPQNLDGVGRQYFSDPTHQDHIHIGYLGT